MQAKAATSNHKTRKWDAAIPPERQARTAEANRSHIRPFGPEWGIQGTQVEGWKRYVQHLGGYTK